MVGVKRAGRGKMMQSFMGIRKMYKFIVLVVVFAVIGALTSSASAFLEDTKPNINYIGPVGAGTWLYEYRGSSGWCGIVVGQLHGKTVSIDCESY